MKAQSIYLLEPLQAISANKKVIIAAECGGIKKDERKNKMRNIKRILAAVLSAVMLLSLVPLSAFAAKEQPAAAVLPDGSIYIADEHCTIEELNDMSIPDLARYGTIISKNEYGTTRLVTDPAEIAAILGENYDPSAEADWLVDIDEYNNEIVDVIVLTDKAAFVETKGLTVGDKIDADAYNAARTEMIREHEAIAGKITRTVKADPAVIANYCMTVNGFAVRAARRDISAIKKLSGVKLAFEAPTYSAPESEFTEVEPNEVFNSGAEQQGTFNAWDCGYKGEGMSIAVIDTGCYLNHTAFSTAPANPKYTRESIENLLNTYDFEAESRMQEFDADLAYKTAKFPFVFDYSEDDADVNHTGGVSAHGTHVAGIAAAWEAEHELSQDDWFPGVTGVAPEAQLVILKVFSANSASFTNIISAMEDAILLGVDAINLSLGSPAGFDYEEGVTEVFDAANAAGINVVTSAGNETTSSVGNRWGYNYSLAMNPDNGVVGSPGTFASNLTVASADAKTCYNPGSSYLMVNQNYGLVYYDPAPMAYRAESVYPDTFFNLAIIEDNNFDGLDLTGKMAVVFENEDITAHEFYTMAHEAGASILLIVGCNDDDTYADMSSIESYEAMPCITVEGWIWYDEIVYWMVDEFALPVEEWALGINHRYDTNAGDTAMSDFSSWGPTGDLRIKPEITAIGGNVYSTWSWNGYAISSGTSMSAPQVAGATVLVKQALRQRFPELTSQQIHDIANAMLMSTATQVKGVHEFDCSPRRQGAGMINIPNAVLSDVYLSVDGCDKPKLELGDDPEKLGEYTLTFNVVNMGGSEKHYTVDVSTITEFAVSGEIKNGEPLYFMYGDPYKLNPVVSGDTEVTVPAFGTTSVTVTVKLSESDLIYINDCFKNGAYVEGFVKLSDTAENDGINLSLPYLAFYGDWTALNTFDNSFGYDCLSYLGMDDGLVELLQKNQKYPDLNYASVSPHMVLTSVNGQPHYLGDGFYCHLDPTFEPYVSTGMYPWTEIGCYISPNGDGICDGIEAVYTGLLRNAKNVTYRITDVETGEVYYEKLVGDYTKYTQDSKGNQIPLGMDADSVFDPWYGTDAHGDPLPEGTVVYVSVECDSEYRGEAVTDNTLDSWGFLCCIDNTAPTFEPQFRVETDESSGKQYYTLLADASDEGNLANVTMALRELSASGSPMGATMYYAYSAEYRGSGCFEGHGFSRIQRHMFYYFAEAIDFAGNRVMVTFDSTAGDSAIEMDCGNNVNMLVGDTLDITNVFEWNGMDIPGDFTTFESADESIVSVETLSDVTAKLTALAEGQTTIHVAVPCTVSTQDITVNVYERTYDIVSSANEGGSITAGGTFNTYDDAAFAITPNDGYMIADVLVDGESVGAVTEYSFNNIRTNHAIEAVFAKQLYRVTFVDGLTGDIISYADVPFMEDAILPEAPAHPGYSFAGWNGSYTAVTANSIVVAYYTPAQSGTPGDVDGNGSIEITDALLVLRWSMGIIELSDAQLLLADMNGDNAVDVSDALMIMRASLQVQ